MTTHVGPEGPKTGTTQIVLSKHHGLGNDFLIAVDPPRFGPRGEGLSGADAKAWCDRHVGVGADGLIVATPVDGHVSGAEDAHPRRWRMVLFNADGGRAEISGNGLRCLGQAIVGHLALDRAQDQELTVETDAGVRHLNIRAANPGDDDGTAMVRATMGRAADGPGLSPRWADVGVDIIEQYGVDIGNPHLVAFVDSLGSADMARIGPVIEADYPGGLNVHLVEVVGDHHIDLRIWERGAGVTQACGSGACAAAWAGDNAGLVHSPVEVTMPGGSATVELEDGEISLTGPAVRVAEVIING